MKPVRNILFVDDEPAFLQALKRILHTHRQWNILVAESADKAIALTEGSRIDVIVSDVQMPGKTGFDLLKILQNGAHTYEIPIIILTGNAEKDLKRQALELGATDLLNKPVSYEDLVARISNCLRLKEYQDEIRNQNMTLEEKVKERTAELEYLHQDIIWRLAKAGELRDQETGEHLVRVAHYSKLLADKLDLGEEDAKNISFTSCLHDLGKIGIPDRILLKEGKLDAEEWQIMQTHCAIGASILLDQSKASRSFKQQSWQEQFHGIKKSDKMREMAAVIAISHHEKWDGSGYPNGLKGNDIPITGRIVAMADVYDALRSKRPYKEPLSAQAAEKIIVASSAKHFSPELVAIFLECAESFDRISTEYS